MRYLVDTHVFLWWMTEPSKLSPTVVSTIEKEPGEIAFSSISAWEIAIKSALGKVRGVPIGDIPAEIAALGWIELKFSLRHASAVADLPFHHHDPFDRALIAQTIAENLTFVTADAIASRYPVKVLW
ncbi:MAG TPA: type II toxin-antitoxin system VapC family toxin [Spirochaetia bacterium]|nr:type II toxin-antitoxin system VapC family toxin [Spirochaetia bacterium]